jgi:MFS family permease
VLSLVPLLMIETGPKQEESQPRNEDDREAARVEDDSAEPAGQAQPWWIGRIERLLGRVPEPWRGMLRHPVPILQLLVPPFFISWGAALLIPYLNIFFKERFDVSDGVLGVIFAALGITTGLSALLGPVLSARIGKSRTIVVAQALSIPFLLTMGYVPLLSVAVGAALMRGVLFNMGSPLYDAFAMERTGAEARPAVIGLINGAYSVGYLVAPIISTLVQERYGFGPLFVATAICYGLAVVATYWFFVRQRDETAKKGRLNRQDAKIAKN